MKLYFSVRNFVGIKMPIVSKQYVGFMLTSDCFMNLAFEKVGEACRSETFGSCDYIS